MPLCAGCMHVGTLVLQAILNQGHYQSVYIWIPQSPILLANKFGLWMIMKVSVIQALGPRPLVFSDLHAQLCQIFSNV